MNYVASEINVEQVGLACYVVYTVYSIDFFVLYGTMFLLAFNHFAAQNSLFLED